MVAWQHRADETLRFAERFGACLGVIDDIQQGADRADAVQTPVDESSDIFFIIGVGAVRIDREAEPVKLLDYLPAVRGLTKGR